MTGFGGVLGDVHVNPHAFLGKVQVRVMLIEIGQDVIGAGGAARARG